MRTGGKGKTMTDLLVKLFIKNADQTSSPKVRERYGLPLRILTGT